MSNLWRPRAEKYDIQKTKSKISHFLPLPIKIGKEWVIKHQSYANRPNHCNTFHGWPRPPIHWFIRNKRRTPVNHKTFWRSSDCRKKQQITNMNTSKARHKIVTSSFACIICLNHVEFCPAARVTNNYRPWSSRNIDSLEAESTAHQ